MFTSKFVGTGPSSYEKRIYPAAVSQRMRNTALKKYGFLIWRHGRYTVTTMRCISLVADTNRYTQHSIRVLESLIRLLRSSSSMSRTVTGGDDRHYSR